MRVRALLAGAVALMALPAPALAHEGNPDFSSEISGIEPAVPGVEAEILNFDDSIELRNRGDEAVVVLGYEDEPYVRIHPDGRVEVNHRSPSYYLNQDRFAEVEVPAVADPDAPPDWQVENDSGQYAWHDHRVHYMAQGTPPQVEDEAVRTKVFDYEVPLLIGDRRANVVGSLYWVGEDGGFPLLPFIGLGVFALACVAAVLLIRRRRSAGDGASEEAREAW